MSSDANPDYAVGYGRPPASTRFKAGRSGNPAGRPKSSSPTAKDARFLKTLQEVFNAEAKRVVTVTEGGRRVKLTAEQAVIRSLVNRAINGDGRAAAQYIKLASLRPSDEVSADVRVFNELSEYKLGVAKDLEFRYRGVLPPELPIHPDDIIVEFRNKTVKINGPRDAVERAEWGEAEHAVSVLRASLAETSLAVEREAIQEEIDEILDVYPPASVRRTEIFDLDVWRAGGPRRQRERQAARDKARAVPPPGGAVRPAGASQPPQGKPHSTEVANKSGGAAPLEASPAPAKRPPLERPPPPRRVPARGPADLPTRVVPTLTIVPGGKRK